MRNEESTPESIRPPAQPFSGEALARLGRLVRKELLEILRDRRTIITLVAMPLLLYPLLSIAFQQFIRAQQFGSGPGSEIHLGYADRTDMEEFDQFLTTYDEILSKAAIAAPETKKTAKQAAFQQRRWKWLEVDDLEAAVKAGMIDLGVYLVRVSDPGQRQGSDVQFRCRLVYMTGAARSLAALRFVEACISAHNNKSLEERLNLPGTSSIVYYGPIREPLEQAGADGMLTIASLIPLILILMTITGAVYPAIDLTAGERERGTLEILVAAPVPRLGLLFAKYVTVVTVAVLTAVMNLVSMMLTLVFTGLGQALFGEQGPTLLLVVQLFGLLILFAAFFSAVLLTLTSFARSFKEAQAYLIPLMLASLGPGLIGMMGGELTVLWAAVPLVNIVLLARDLFQGGADPALAGLVVLSTLLYAAAAITLAARIFGAEGVLYNEQTGWGDLFRRPQTPQPSASVPSALWCLALMLPIYVAAQWVASQLAEFLSGAGLMFVVAALSVLLFGVLPAIWAWYGRVEWRRGFGVVSARPVALLGGVILGVSLWPLILGLLVLLHKDSALEGSALEGSLQQAGGVMERLRSIDPPWLPVAVFIVVAIVEELFFRGYLFAALRPQVSKWGTIGVSALLFGLFHVVQWGPDRLPSSTLLGFLLGWLCWETGSVLPGMLLHGLTNGLLASLIQSRLVQGSSVPPSLVFGGVLGTAAGLALVWFLGRQPLKTDVSPPI